MEQDDPDAFSTEDFIDKVKETLKLSTEILQNPLSKNEKISTLLKLQCCNALQLLSTLNTQNEQTNVNRIEYDFQRPNFTDSQRLAQITEINDAVIDKTIFYTDYVNNLSDEDEMETGGTSQELIQVDMKIRDNKSEILIKDFQQQSSAVNSPMQRGQKRKSDQLNMTPGSSPFGSSPNYNNNNNNNSNRRVMFLASANIKRPQTVYSFKVDNNYSTPFIPRLTQKFNSIVPLEESIKPVAILSNATTSSLLTKNVDSKSCTNMFTFPTHYYPHPYQTEIERFEVKMDFLENEDVTEDVMMKDQQQPPSSTNLKPFKLISRKDELIEMIQTLKQTKEIAVDVEHHNFRTYQGITCLLQISTDDDDFIVDVFPLWNDLQLLNQVFTDPSILKVFHGADFDIIWLQRDLGVYVVNMFDTGIAAKMLNLSHCSLSYLVSQYCQFQMDKRFQLADWRIRPIPAEMLDYARLDTHFLLYIFRRLKRDLLEQSDASANLLRIVMEKSKELCLKRYEKKILEPTDHVYLVLKNNLRFNNRQLAALKSLYAWRDIIARNEDESTGYVLPNNLLLKICEILPREQQGVLACCTPIPPLVRQNINDIHKIILEARSMTITESVGSMFEGGAQRKVDRSIDLSNDWLIDQHDNVSGRRNFGHHSQDIHDDMDSSTMVQNMEIVPMLSWLSERSRFVPTKQYSSMNSMAHQIESSNNLLNSMEIDLNNIGENIIDVSATTSRSMSNMFVSNVSEYIRNDIEKRQTRNKVATMFESYVSPYQRYMKKIEENKKPLNNTKKK